MSLQRPANPDAGSVTLSVVAFLESTAEPAEPSRIAHAVELHGGRVVQIRGPLVFAAFSSPSACFRASRALRSTARIGISCGDVVHERGLIHGLPVIEASRLMQQARPGQILCADRLLDMPGVEEHRAPLQTRIVKGISDRFRCREILDE